MRKITMFIFLLTCSTVLLAMQQPTIQHTVSKGETIYSLTKRYQITEEVLYRYNPQIRSGLQANAVIEIPSVAFQQEPTSFIEHKVKRKETLFSLAQEYHVSIDQIKKYNSELYARDLNRGEVIRIPVFQKGKQKPAEGLVEYIVKPKEGKWRIAQNHGISEAELERINPNMKTVLNEGDIIWVPANKIDSGEYTMYAVQQGEGFFALKRKFNVTEEQLIALNPQLAGQGLKAGMELKLPKKRDAIGQGEVSLLDQTAADQLLRESMNVNQPQSLAFVLPFKLEKGAEDSLGSLRSKLENDRLVGYAVDFYSGALMALDSAKSMGFNLKVKVLDSEGSESAISKLLAQNTFKGTQWVVGPFLPKVFNTLSSGLLKDSIPVLAPLSNKNIELYDNVFQTLPT